MGRCSVLGCKSDSERKLPDLSFNSKPRCVSCMAFTGAVLMLTLSAVAFGILLGYTYCYIEQQTTVTVKTGNVSQSTFQILHIPFPDSEEEKYNRTINGAVMSNVIMSRILKIGQAMMGDDLSCVPFSQDEHIKDIENL